MTDKTVRVDFEKLEISKEPQKEIDAGELRFAQLIEEDDTFLTENDIHHTEKQPKFQLSIKNRTNVNNTKASDITGNHLFAERAGDAPFYVSATPPRGKYYKVEFDCHSDDKGPAINGGIVWLENKDGMDTSLHIQGTSYTGKYTASITGSTIKKIFLRCSGKGSAFDNFMLTEKSDSNVNKP
ncbi:hypothetical protein ACIP01_00415 [Pseudomonas monteilii]|uniref:hypothetical protein n=1 Tax=Pseudomonas monteilii TaxID=76759 RepID=UPI00382D7032